MTEIHLKIRQIGDPCLRKKSLAVKEVGPAQRLLIQSMIETMYEEKGVGLAAPQVGVNERILIADIGEGTLVVINPKVLKRTGIEVMEEGCLSVPETIVKVKRPKKILLKYIDENNRALEKVFEGLMARVILHETDHLNGKLIVDYAGFFQKCWLKKQETMEKTII
jgi:peptide deformylase